MTMPALTLHADNYQTLLDSLADNDWIVACLCAEWCGTCRGYRKGFDEMAERHPDKHFIWIDVEDHADLLGDLDAENFPTMLIQRGDIVTYFAPVLPDHRQVERMLAAQIEQGDNELRQQAGSSPERIEWQNDCNLRQLLRAAVE
ncbi:MAG: thiol reductase thioredoxin [Burkholderiaceae bacterium]|nr:thiol reductase thioredoxin [Burkholderiaceae bacterium]